MAVPDDQDDERELIMDAAYRCLLASEGVSVAITDILHAAGLSTRAFYRHFASKDSLLLALFRRDCERVTAELTSSIDAAATAREALRRWIDGVLHLMSTQPRRRALILSSEETLRARGFAAERERFQTTQEEALSAILRRGVEDGSFPWADPLADAEQIQAVLGRALDRQLLCPPADSPTETADRVTDFVFRALGASGGTAA